MNLSRLPTSSCPFSSSIPTGLESITGSQLLSGIRAHKPLQTGHAGLDLLLKTRPLKRKHDPVAEESLGGLSRGDHVQLEGPPGVGKTKLAVGIAVRARADSILSRRTDVVEVLYIDADGSASPELLKLSAQSLVASLEAEKREGLVDKICLGIHLVRVTTTAELAFFFLRLPNWLREHSNTKLVILDSITAHTRYVSMTIEERTLVGQYIREGIKLATVSFNCAVIVTVQPVSAKKPTDPDITVMVPPYFRSRSGWSSSPAISSVQMVFDPDGTRKAVVFAQDPLLNVPGKIKGVVGFEINDVGIYEPTELRS